MYKLSFKWLIALLTQIQTQGWKETKGKTKGCTKFFTWGPIGAGRRWHHTQKGSGSDSWFRLSWLKPWFPVKLTGFLTPKNTSKVAIIFHRLAKITWYHQEPVTTPHGITTAHGVLIRVITPGVQLGWRGGNGKANSRIIRFTRAMPFLGIFNQVLFINITVVRIETITRRFQFHHIVTVLKKKE
jgi:hypothetical protein